MHDDVIALNWKEVYFASVVPFIKAKFMRFCVSQNIGYEQSLIIVHHFIDVMCKWDYYQLYSVSPKYNNNISRWD